MTLQEMKKKVLRMIEEISDSTALTDDPDIAAKLNDVINQVMFEIARMKKIPAKVIKTIAADNLDLDLRTVEGFYQLDNMRFTNADGEELEYDLFGTNAAFPEAGKATIYYYKYPERITDDTDDTEYTFELSDDALEVIPYGIAADLLKSDVSNNYGQVYETRYKEMLQTLDSRYSTGQIYIESEVLFE
ncbi:MAG: hypothetical protein ACI4LK_02345 [Lentihominibacter sp.]